MNSNEKTAHPDEKYGENVGSTNNKRGNLQQRNSTPGNKHATARGAACDQHNKAALRKVREIMDNGNDKRGSGAAQNKEPSIYAKNTRCTNL